MRYREQVGELVKMRRKTDSSKAYSAWLYATKRQIVAKDTLCRKSVEDRCAIA